MASAALAGSDQGAWLCVSSAELTHEFLQILEKTPSRLKRIRNWRVRTCSGVLCVAPQCDSAVTGGRGGTASAGRCFSTKLSSVVKMMMRFQPHHNGLGLFPLGEGWG